MSQLDCEQYDTSVDMGESGDQFASREAELPFPRVTSNENKTDDVCCCWWYTNAATCPDCGAGMVRLGSCFSCQSCGYESCAG